MFAKLGRLFGYFVILLASVSAAAPADGSGMTAGETFTIYKGTVETFSQMAKRSENTPAAKLVAQREVWNPHDPTPEQELRSLAGEKAAGEEKAYPVPEGEPVMKPNLIFDAGGMSGGFPPDTNGAVGPEHVMIMINFAARIYDRQGNSISSASLDSVFSMTYNGTAYPKAGSFDPRIVYDSRSQRWIAVALDFGDSYVVNGNTRRHRNYTMLAISHTSDPTGSWTKYLINSKVEPTVTESGTIRYFTDYPTLGVDDNGIYLGYRVFPSSGSSYAMIIAADKKQFLNGNSTLFGGKWKNITDMYSAPYPCVVMDAVAPDDAQFFISTNPSVDSNKLNYRRIKWDGTTPRLSSSAMTFSVDKVKNTLNSSALGSTTNINTGDRRLSSAPIRRGSEIMLTRSVGMDSTGDNGTVTRTGQELHRIRVFTVFGFVPKADRQFLASIDLDRVFSNASTPYFFHHGSIALNGRKHYVAAFAASRATEYVGSSYTSAKKTSFVREPTLYSTGTHPYTQLDSASTPRNRWGDYTSTFVDPNNDSSIWSFQQRAGNTNNSFRIVAARFDMPSPFIFNINYPQLKIGETVDIWITGKYFHHIDREFVSDFSPPRTPSVALLLPAVQAAFEPEEVEVVSEEVIRVRVTIPENVKPGLSVSVRVINPDGQEYVLKEAAVLAPPTEPTPTPAPSPTPTPTPTPLPPPPEQEPITTGDICATQQGLSGLRGVKARGTRLAPEIGRTSCALEEQNSAIAFSFYLPKPGRVNLLAEIAPVESSIEDEEPRPVESSMVALSVRRCCSEPESEIACERNENAVDLTLNELREGYYTVLVQTEEEQLVILQYESAVALEPLVYMECPTGPTPTPTPVPTPVLPRNPCNWSQSLRGSEGLVAQRMFQPTADFEYSPCAGVEEQGYVASWCFRVPEEGASVLLVGTAYLINSDSASDWDGDEEVQGVDVTEGYKVAFSLREMCGSAATVIQCETGIQEEDILLEERLPAGLYTLTGEAPYESGFRVMFTSDVELDGSCGTRPESWMMR